MARSITIRDIDRRAGVTYIRVGKNEVEIPGSINDLRAWIQSQFSEDSLLALALAVYLARDPNLTNPGQIVGRTITLDLTGRVDLAGAVLRVT